MGRGTGSLLGITLAAATLLAIGACRTPTQVTVVVSTRVRCIDLPSGTVIAVAATPQASEENVVGGFASATTRACTDDGAIGTLVITPGADTAAVVVTAGFGGQDTAKCTPKNKFKDCIVARRSFAFVEHTRLTLPIELTLDCLNVPCDTLTTCSKGACVPARVECTGDGCTGIDVDGGGIDGGPIGDAALDGADAPDGPDPNADGGLTSDLKCGVTLGGAMAFRMGGGVSATVPFCIDRTEVTQAAYAAFLATVVGAVKNPGCDPGKPSFVPAPSGGGSVPCSAATYSPAATPSLPVTCVDRCDAAEFCGAMGKALCTHDQWQLACNSNASNYFPYGGKMLADYQQKACNGADLNLGHTVEVATLPGCVTTAPTTVFDLSGNVWEWINGSMLRGGGFKAGAPELSCNPGVTPGEPYTAEIGFRCCKPAP